MVLSLLNHCFCFSISLWGLMLGPHFAKQYFVPCLVLLKKESWFLYFKCLLDVLYQSILCLFHMVSWVGLQCVIFAFPGHTRLHLKDGSVSELTLHTFWCRSQTLWCYFLAWHSASLTITSVTRDT